MHESLGEGLLTERLRGDGQETLPNCYCWAIVYRLLGEGLLTEPSSRSVGRPSRNIELLLLGEGRSLGEGLLTESKVMPG
ncbi:MAG: hypothetical protein ABIK79_11550 [Chloroflexota bacterium]|nr:hypothetical protein [Anaerolineae bacterium]